MRKDAEKNNNNNNNFEEIMAIKAKAKTTLKLLRRRYNNGSLDLGNNYTYGRGLNHTSADATVLSAEKQAP